MPAAAQTGESDADWSRRRGPDLQSAIIDL
jgi:hypothetical protein